MLYLELILFAYKSFCARVYDCREGLLMFVFCWVSAVYCIGQSEEKARW